MKISEILNAAPALQKLTAQDLPLRDAHVVAALVTRCNEQLRFYGQQVDRIRAIEDAAEAEKRHKALLSLDADGFDDFKPLQLPLNLPIMLSAADVKCLEPLIVFG